jgi:hypothetical protein
MRSFRRNVARTVASLGIHLQRTPLQSPWQNGTAERFVGTVRRELLDHVVVLGEDHLRRLLREFVEYYNTDRVSLVHRRLAGRGSLETKPSERAKVIRLPRAERDDDQHRHAQAVAAGYNDGQYGTLDYHGEN